MSIHFPCRRCRQPLTVRLRQAGTPVICPNCKGETLAPSSSEPTWPPPPTAVLPAPPTLAAPPAPRLGILVPRRARRTALAPTAVPVAKPVPPPPLPAPAPMAAPARARRPWHRSRGRRLLAAAGAVTLLLAAVLTVAAWPRRAQPPAPPESFEVAQGPEAPAAGLGADDLPDELIDALPPHQEEWVEERPVAAGPDDPAEPVLGPPSGIEVPDLAAKAAVAVAPPLPAPGAVAKLKRRDRRAEEDLRKQLAGVPEIGLDRTLLPSLVWEYREQQEASLTYYAAPDLEPRPLYALYPGVKGLQMRHGREARLDARHTATLDVLSRKLRVYVSKLAPADRTGKRPDAARLRAVMYAEMRGPRPEWLRAEAVPVLMQMLTHEDTVLRRLLVEILSEIDHRTATAALAQRALSDLDADLRAFAIESLRRRPADDYLDVLLRALRHPLPMLADHAAEALVALDAKGAVPALVTMLPEPDPTAPYPAKDGGRPLVRELVRTNHLANCLLCHPPSVTYFDPVPGVIPNARWLYPVVEHTLSVTPRPGIQTTVVTGTGTRTVSKTVVPAAPPQPANPPAPANPSRPPATQKPPSTTAQQIINLVNLITSQTTSTGSTTQTGCHDYTADVGIVPGVTVPPTKPKPPGKSPKKPGSPAAPPGNSPSQPANPPANPVVPQSSAPLPIPPRTVTRFSRVPFRTPVVQQTPVVGRSTRPQTDVTIINLPVLVRGDVTYLRQDFSVQQPVLTDAAPQPASVDMRFDYFVRTRRATPDEVRAAKDADPGRTYEQREAVLFALRGLTGQDAGPTTEAWQGLYPDAESDSQASRLAAEVTRAQGDARRQAVARLRDGKGTVYTDALAAAVPRLNGAAQEQAREALVQRLARMTSATLRNKLGEDSAEVRRAAALACARKEDEALVPDLLGRLDDAEEAVAQAVRQALGGLTGKEFASAREWREWWEKE